MRKLAFVLAALLSAGFITSTIGAEKKEPKNPFLPGEPWRVNDFSRPTPRVVTPGERFSQGAQPPSDATVLFNGTDLSNWKGEKGPARWKVENGYMEVVKKTGDISTKEEFGNFQLHLEFATPAKVKGHGQDRGNSGVFLFGRYEVQVLDSYDNRTYPDGQCGALYGQCPPLVNAVKKPGEWQSYDITFEAPEWNAAGKVIKPAYVTVILNGVVVHNHKNLIGNTEHAELASYGSPQTRGPIVLQDHGEPVRYRNIWIRSLGQYDKP